jgi:ATP-dependent protease ClpP protease subunit
MATPLGLEIQNASSQSADIYIYGVIGASGVSAPAFVAQIQALRCSRLNVHIHSGGGSVFDGFAIYNAIHHHPAKAIVHIDGLAASMASVIAMAGDEIIMPENAMMMIHKPYIPVVGGTADEIRQSADLVKQVENNIVSAYAKRTGLAEGEIRSMIASGDKYLTARECLTKGFCTSVSPAKELAASVDLGAFGNIPKVAASISADPLAAVNAIRAEYTQRLAAKQAENDDLRAKLEYAESMSAYKLGVPPITNVRMMGEPSEAEILARYKKLSGADRQAFFEKNKAAIWAASGAGS